jgi:SAM-dependent methyltransferase
MNEEKNTHFIKSANIVYLYNNEIFYIFHNLFGYIIELSRDLIDFLEEFKNPCSFEEIRTKFSEKYAVQQIDDFLAVFRDFSCILEQGKNEEDSVWKYFSYRGKWTLSYTDDNGVTSFYTGRRDGTTSETVLTGVEQRFMELADGTRNLEQTAGELGHESVLSCVKKFAHHDLQALKLCRFPFSFFRNREVMLPPYLKSAAPFDVFNPESASGQKIFSERIISPVAYYSRKITDPARQFEEIETTISHLFSEPHPALNGETYGARFSRILHKRGIFGKNLIKKRILEIGGGTGYFARDFLNADLQISRENNFEPETTYVILDISSVLSEKQKETVTVEGVKFEQIIGNAEEFSDMPSGFDLIICNEVISDLSVVRLKKEEISSQDVFRQISEAHEPVMKYGLSLKEAPEEFFLNTGAIKFMENAWNLLKPGGTCIIVEFGEENHFPVFSSQLDHPEFSIHFGHLMQAADVIGFTCEFEHLTDFLEIDLGSRCLATTRCFHVALKYMLSRYNIQLRKIAYTKEMFEDLVKDKIDLKRIRDLHFENIEHRCMGLSPREFKVLSLCKPLPQYQLDYLETD